MDSLHHTFLLTTVMKVQIPKLAAHNNQFNLPATHILSEVKRVAANKNIFYYLILTQNYINTLLYFLSRLFCLMSTDCSSLCPLSHVLFCVFIPAWHIPEALQEPVCGLTGPSIKEEVLLCSAGVPK